MRLQVVQVEEHRPDTGRYLLRYDDGDTDWVNLDQERLDWGGGTLWGFPHAPQGQAVALQAPWGSKVPSSFAEHRVPSSFAEHRVPHQHTMPAELLGG